MLTHHLVRILAGCALLATLRADFGKISVDHVERQGGPDAPLQVFVKGTVASGIIWIGLDDDSRFESVKPEVRGKTSSI